MATAIMTAINSPAHFFIQLPETSTFQHLSRLEDCMYYVYEKMQDRVPKVNNVQNHSISHLKPLNTAIDICLHKVNGVNLREQKLPLKCYQPLEMVM